MHDLYSKVCVSECGEWLQCAVVAVPKMCSQAALHS